MPQHRSADSPDAMDAPVQAFWIGGYEGADHVNGLGEALDMQAASGHLRLLEDDHRRAAALGLGAVRESIGWRLSEPRPGEYDFGRALRIAASARSGTRTPNRQYMHRVTNGMSPPPAIPQSCATVT